ncbi:F-box only protein 3-like [Montipora foliosa]|uniref:F-box only protein 3-like n=1 Tax=Montipora foliosa TaxID=591990 RepID=UPI0035F146FF
MPSPPLRSTHSHSWVQYCSWPLKMAESCNYLQSLPVVPLSKIFSFLGKEDVAKCSQVCSRFSQVASSLPSWKKWCEDIWLVDECPPGTTWKQLFSQWQTEWGRYESCYASIKRAWAVIEEFIRLHCPAIHASLNEGLTEEELAETEVNKLNGLQLPNDLRCSLRIRNGQRLVSPGLIGSMAISNHYQSECLLELSVALSGLQRRDGLRNCIPVSFCVHTGNGQFMALTNEEGHNRGEIFWPSPDRSVDNFEVSSMRMHHFLSGTNFASWLCAFAEKLSNNCYPVIDNEIYTFSFSDKATTKGITIVTTTAFLPELSSVKPPLFFFTYRISISMDPEVSMMNKCQLTTRHWYITDANGIKEEVHGDGVVGEFPTMYPGALHQYISCTTFRTPTGQMEGHYVFRYLNKTGTFNVKIPSLNFNSLPFVLAEKRLENV